VTIHFLCCGLADSAGCFLRLHYLAMSFCRADLSLYSFAGIAALAAGSAVPRHRMPTFQKAGLNNTNQAIASKYLFQWKMVVWPASM
jgi:hypothetical protein